VQIKEKFGGLRYYVNYHGMSDDDIQQIEYIIRNAEMKTFAVCEDCGGNGEKVSPRRYWMKTLCPDCQNKYDMGDTPNGI
jgi:hydrogenase maturation factor HypF (carbamoyltransferase family)